jgi:Gti1/Pac2 family
MPQSPTCTNIKIRSVRDAQAILYACHEGLLSMIKTRLDSGDRHALASGNVYAWEERGSRSEPAGVGIERFTEGKRWTPSRLREVCISYPLRPLANSQYTHTHRISFTIMRNIYILARMINKLCTSSSPLARQHLYHAHIIASLLQLGIRSLSKHTLHGLLLQKETVNGI